MAANVRKAFWPNGPADQTTPKAPVSAKNEEPNPFESLTSAGGAPGHDLRASHSRGGSGGGLAALHISGDQTPSGLRTPGGVTSHAAVPTTSISTVAPDFTMKLPAPKPKAEALATTSSATRNTSAPRGHLTIKIHEARNLASRSESSRPYVLVQCDKNEFIGTDVPCNEPRSDVDTSTASSQPHRCPVWNESVTFDIMHEGSPIFISVYDREADEEGFLGMREIRPRLVHRMTSDQWYPLTSRDPLEDASGDERGEVRVEMRYEKLAAKRLTPRDFEYLKLIGRGTFGRVFQVRKKDTRRIYAMKVLSKREIAMKKEVTHTMGERRILEKSLDCPFLVGLKFSFQSESELYFVTDYKSGGELFWHLQREGRFTEERARFYIAELVLALEHLHKYDIVYRDLKPENILLDAQGHVALCDFGLSKPDLGAGQLTNTFCGTTEYLAPEVLLDESGYSKLVDFWSLGVLLFEMCCGWSPFYAEDTQQMYRNICFGKIKFPRGAIGDDGKQFVKGLLNRNPKHRLGAQRDAVDLKMHPFFSDVDFDALSKKQVTPPFKPLVESDESVANFDPEFTETDLQDISFMPDFDGDEMSVEAGVAAGGLHKGAAPTTNGITAQGKTPGAVNIKDKKGDGEDDSPLSSSVQDKFRGFSYSGTYEGSVAGSFGGRSRRGSNGFGLAGASLGMSRMEVDDAKKRMDEDSDVDMESS